LSTKAYWYGQQFYFSGTYGVIRYLHQVQDDANVYSLSAGDNWTLTSRCAGNLGVQLNRAPSLITEQVGVGINYSTVTSASESAKCAVSNGYSLVFNSGWTKLFNTNALNAVNNSQTVMLSAGIEYAKGPDSLTALATTSDTNYGQRNALINAVGLANVVDYHSFSLNYVRQITPDLTVTGQVGLIGVSNAFSLGLPRTLLPTYSVSAAWTVTPKVALTASASRTVAPPTTVIANAETSYQTRVGLTYNISPKLTFGAGGSIGYSSAAFTPGLAGTIYAPYLTATNFYGVNATLSYSVTPFVSAALAATYTERERFA